MKPNKKLTKAGAVGALTVAAFSTQAHAINVQQYSPSVSSSYVMTEDASLDASPSQANWKGMRFNLGVTYNWVNDPLVEVDATRVQRYNEIIDGLHTLNLGAGLFFGRRFSINLDLPLNLVHPDAQANQFALGDLRTFAKWRLTQDNALVSVAIVPELRFPSGSREFYLSDESITPGIGVAIEKDFKVLRVAANVGYRYSPNATFRDIDYRHRMPLALGLYIPVTEKFGFNAEASGNVTFPVDRFNTPGEIYGGVRWLPIKEIGITGGMALGNLGRVVGNDIRAIFGLRFNPIPEEKPVVAVVTAPPAPPKPIASPQPIVVIEKEKPKVVFTPEEIMILEEVKFKHNSSEITDSGKKILDEVATTIKKHRSEIPKLMVEGHTNELGSVQHNQKLSVARAHSVLEYLSSRGIEQKILNSQGFGKSRPKKLPGYMTKDAVLAANRRVEFKILKK
jgi:outer membrane protein OmpA-like peptidoglycan-associated protein